MKIGTKGHYALAAMVQLAKKRKNPHHPIPLTLLANDQGISLNYLELLFVKLRRAGLVTSIRGVRGGYLLSHSPECIMVLDVITAVGEGMRVNRCEAHSSETSHCFDHAQQCLMHNMWESLSHHIRTYLGSISIEDLAQERSAALLKFAPQVPTCTRTASGLGITSCRGTEKAHEIKKGLHLSGS